MDFEQWVRGFCENIASHLDLAGWRVELDFSVADSNDDFVTAKTKILGPYKQVILTVYPVLRTWFEAGDIERIVGILVHEFVHILLDPFDDWIAPHLSTTTAPLFIDTLERQTQTITMILLKTLPKNITPKTK